jgi:hypothetical protein
MKKFNKIVLCTFITTISSLIVTYFLYFLILKNCFNTLNHFYNKFFYENNGLGFILLSISLYIIISLLISLLLNVIFKNKSNKFNIIAMFILLIIILSLHIVLTFFANNWTFFYWFFSLLSPLYFNIIYNYKISENKNNKNN